MCEGVKNNHRYNFELVKTNIKKYIRYHSCIKNFDYNKPIIKNIIYIKVLKKLENIFIKKYIFKLL
jgi:hypothetical protein